MGATHAEKSTVQNAGQLNAVSSGMGGMSAAPVATAPVMAAPIETSVAPDLGDATPATDVKFCAIDDPGCEACQ